MIFSPQMVELLASPFHKVPGKFEFAVALTRIMFPFLLLVALAAQAMGVLNATGQFGIPAHVLDFLQYRFGGIRAPARLLVGPAARDSLRSTAWRGEW